MIGRRWERCDSWHVACDRRSKGGRMKDPVCGRNVEAVTVAAETQYDGKTYRFCSDDCYQEFMLDPAEYAGEQAEG